MNSLPHSVECERAVLAAILLSPASVLPTVSVRLRPRDFYTSSHQIIYKAVLDLWSSNVEPDLRTLQALLEQHQQFDAVGGITYLAGLDLDLPDLGRIDNYIEIVKERSQCRDLITGCRNIAVAVATGELTSTDGIDVLAKQISELGQVGTDNVSCFCELTDATVAALEDRSDGLIGLSWGYDSLDLFTQGMSPGSLIIIAGRPAMGKSAFAQNVAQHVAFRLRRSVLFISVEMSEQELCQRVLASEAKLPLQQLRSGRMSVGQWAHLHDTIRTLNPFPFFIDHSASPSLLEIDAKAYRLRRQHGLDLLIIDYLQLLGADGPNRNEEIRLITRHLKILAKRLEIPIMLISQLSRKPETRNDPKPQLSDLRDSGAIEQEADLVAFVFREEYYRDDPTLKGKAALLIRKQRNGPTGGIDLMFDGQTVTFKD